MGEYELLRSSKIDYLLSMLKVHLRKNDVLVKNMGKWISEGLQFDAETRQRFPSVDFDDPYAIWPFRTFEDDSLLNGPPNKIVIYASFTSGFCILELVSFKGLANQTR